MAAGENEALANATQSLTSANPQLGNAMVQLIGLTAATLVGGDPAQGVFLAYLNL